MSHQRFRPRPRNSRARAFDKGKKGRITAALYRSTRRFKTRSQVSVALGSRQHAAPVSAKADETPQQAAGRQAKLLKRQHEDKLWKAYYRNRSQESRNALWVHYLPLVRYIAEREKSRLPECVELPDLIGAGSFGLQDAIAKFEPAVGVRFETYCVPRIRGAILDSIRDLDWIPRLIRNKAHQFERVMRQLTAELRRDPTEEEIARRLGISLQDFHELQKELDVKELIHVEGPNKFHSECRDICMDTFRTTEAVDPTRELQREEIRRIALNGLAKNERIVLEDYYFRGRSMKQIGEQLGLSESRICQIHAGVLGILRKKLPAYLDSCYID